MHIEGGRLPVSRRGMPFHAVSAAVSTCAAYIGQSNNSGLLRDAVAMVRGCALTTGRLGAMGTLVFWVL